MTPTRPLVILGALCFASLAGNIGLASYMAGRAAMAPGQSAATPGQPPDDMLPQRPLSRLSAEDRAVLEKLGDARRATMREKMNDLRDAHQALRAALSAEPFDSDAFSAALTGMQAAQNALRVSTVSIFQQAAPDLSPEGRRMLAQMLGRRVAEESDPRRFRRGGGDDRPPPPPPRDGRNDGPPGMGGDSIDQFDGIEDRPPPRDQMQRQRRERPRDLSGRRIPRWRDLEDTGGDPAPAGPDGGDPMAPPPQDGMEPPQ